MTSAEVLEETLNSPTMKPYGKLNRFLFEALDSKLITKNQFKRFTEELNLLLNGVNRSSSSVPRVTKPLPNSNAEPVAHNNEYIAEMDFSDRHPGESLFN